MRIERIFIESFGAYEQLSIADLGPGLTIILGPNEAGKSTLLEFVRSVFFGFRTRSGKVNTYEPTGQKMRKGWVTVRTDQGERLSIERTEKRGMREGALLIQDEWGTTLDSSTLALYRMGMDRSSYERLFAFDLDKMCHLDRETLRGKIVAAAVGSMDANPLDVMKVLDDRIKVLGKRSTADGKTIWAIHNRMREVDARLKKLDEKPAEYTAAKNSLADVDARRNEMCSEVAVLETAHDNLGLILRYEQEWKRFLALARELTTLQDARFFPVDGVQRLERILDRKREIDEALAETEEALARIREKSEAINPNEVLIDHAGPILGLARRAEILADRPSELTRLSTAITQSYAALDEDLAGLGQDWDRERLGRFDPSLVLERTIRSFEDKWNDFRERGRDLQKSWSSSSDTVTRTEEKIALKQEELRETVPLCRDFLDPRSRNGLGIWKENRTRMENLQERVLERKRQIETLIVERAEADRSATDLVGQEKSPISSVLFWGLVVLLAGSAGGVLYSGSRAAESSSHLLFVVGSLLLGSVALMTIWKVRWERARLLRLRAEQDRLRKKGEELHGSIIEIEAERRGLIGELRHLKNSSDQIGAEVLGNAGVVLEDILEAERRSAAAEEHVRRRRHLEETIEDLQTNLRIEKNAQSHLARDIEQARSEFEELKSRWHSLLASLGLPQTLEPDAALDVLRSVRELKATLRSLAEEEENYSRLRMEWEEFASSVATLGQTMGMPLDRVSPIEAVQEWTQQERISREAMAERTTLQERAGDHEIRLTVLKSKLRDVENESAALLEAGRVADEEAFRTRAARHDRHVKLEQERSILLDSLMSGLQRDDEPGVRSVMEKQEWEYNRAQHEAQQVRLQELRAGAEELASESGRLRQRIADLESEDESDLLLAEREELRERLNRSVKEWITLKLAHGLLNKTLRFYESERQPRVLERSSRLFSQIIGEPSARLLFPMDAHHVILERGNGSRIAEEHLSRGTLEQVYLALRLAHVDVYHRGDSAIPLLMDDVLVNFDPLRAERAAQTLASFADEVNLQILFFTCHPHLVDYFPASVHRAVLDTRRTPSDAR